MGPRPEEDRRLSRTALAAPVLILIAGTVALLWWKPAVQSPNVHLLADAAASYLLVWGAVLLVSRRTPAETAKGFAVTTATLLLLVGLLETAALGGVVDFREVFARPLPEPWDNPGNVTDPVLLHIRKPHSDFVWNGVRYQYDRNGFRNREDSRAADVVVVGDSFMEGWEVPQDAMASSRLGRALGRRVVNLAQSGYGPQQELEVLRRFGLPLAPKVCIWGFFEGNDLGDVYRYEEARRNWGSLVGTPFSQRSFLRNALPAVRRLTGLDEGAQESMKRMRNRSCLVREGDGRSVPMYFWYEGYFLSEKDEASLREVRRLLRQAADLCRARGTDLLVVFIPVKYRVYRRAMECDTGAEPRYWVENALPGRLEAIVREAAPGAGYLDLTPPLAARAGHGGLLYFPIDTHWTNAGHAVAAAEIARDLERRSW
ncbi:MAG TPA: SGNH/GDSL hydrolase family protein [Thermoanaerobaculia bacterium]|nr:SGNH/GDSL hydrolase family protein [Thermoanaerobaculia bacterium]